MNDKQRSKQGTHQHHELGNGYVVPGPQLDASPGHFVPEQAPHSVGAQLVLRGEHREQQGLVGAAERPEVVDQHGVVLGVRDLQQCSGRKIVDGREGGEKQCVSVLVRRDENS